MNPLSARTHCVTFCDSVEDADNLWRSVCDRRPEYELTIFCPAAIGSGISMYACTTLYRKRWERQASEVKS